MPADCDAFRIPMRRISIILLALLAAATLAAEAKTANTGRFTLRGTVSRVVDGDTVDVRLTSGRTERIRLIGIDTPERGECDAAKATAYARSLAQGRAAVLQGDTTQAKRDRYGRLLAYAWIGGHDLGQQQLARGLAKVYVYDRPFQRLAGYQQAERAGKTRADGIWRACASPPPPTPSRGSCDPSYPDVCIPPPPPDLDCKDVPYKKFRVVGADPHRFDSDHDGIGCES
jgi:endonuclease YncB( thermonuclease family)